MLLCGALLAIVLLPACSNHLRTREAVERAIRNRVSEHGLNADNMDVTIASLKFHGDRADTLVAFTPKGAPISQGMSMRYTLEQRGGKWIVIGQSQADVKNHIGDTGLPPDHPAMGGPESSK